MPPGEPYDGNPRVMGQYTTGNGGQWFTYYYSEEAGDGQFVYIVEDDVEYDIDVSSNSGVGSKILV